MKRRTRSRRRPPRPPQLPAEVSAESEIERAKSALDAAIVMLEQARRWLDALPVAARQRVLSYEPPPTQALESSWTDEEALDARKLCDLINASL